MKKCNRTTMRRNKILKILPKHCPHHAEQLHKITLPRTISADNDIYISKWKIRYFPNGFESFNCQSFNFTSHKNIGLYC